MGRTIKNSFLFIFMALGLLALVPNVYGVDDGQGDEGGTISVSTKITLVAIVDTGTNQIYHPFLARGQAQRDIDVISRTKGTYDTRSDGDVEQILEMEKKKALRIIKNKGGIKAVIRSLKKEHNMDFVPAHLDIEWVYSTKSRSAGSVTKEHPITVNKRLYIGEAKRKIR